MDDLLTRGVANIIPHKDELEKKLKSAHVLNIYMGIDPTATRIHLGHAVSLRKLHAFAKMGHHVTFLIGDFTALVGDTSDKESERPLLTPEEIEANFETYKEQASKILDFSVVKVAHNSEWLKKLTYADILKLKKHFSLNDFISRELIKKRLAEGKNVGLLETEYPIMQGYDSYHMDTDLQIGGADQTFNMQAGRILQEDLRHKESFILATNYLTGTDGRKMSKTWGNAIWLDDSPNEMFGKVMSLKDNLIIEYFTLATEVSMEKIKKFEKRLQDGENPMLIKKELAVEIVSELHSKEEGKNALAFFEEAFSKKGVPETAETRNFYYTELEKMDLYDFLVFVNLAKSKSDAKRLIQEGAVEINGEKMLHNHVKMISFKTGTIIRVGRKFIKMGEIK